MVIPFFPMAFSMWADKVVRLLPAGLEALEKNIIAKGRPH